MCVGGGLEQNSAGLRPSRNWVWHPWCKTTGDNVKRKKLLTKNMFSPKEQNKKTVILRWSSPSLGCSRRVSSSASGDGYVSSFPSRFFSVLSLSAAVFTGGLSLLLYSWRSASTSWWPKCVASSIGVLPHLEDINVILFSWFPHLF